jgi:hypothetical protein
MYSDGNQQGLPFLPLPFKVKNFILRIKSLPGSRSIQVKPVSSLQAKLVLNFNQNRDFAALPAPSLSTDCAPYFYFQQFAWYL